MRYRVLVDQVEVGTVGLSPRKLVAGRMACEPAYDRIAPRIRAGSRVLLRHGVYGPPISAHRDRDRRRARIALVSAASLHVELAVDPSGERATTVFVNLIESPIDGGVVVVALFDDAAAIDRKGRGTRHTRLDRAGNKP